MKVLAWLWFVVVQLLSNAPFLLVWPFWHVSFAWGIALALLTSPVAFGCWVFLIPFCFTHAWEMSPVPSIKDGKRAIDRWKWKPLNWVCGQPEDGVSGTFALIRDDQPYRPNTNPALRAWLWNARNPCGQLKYYFAWKSGPFKQWTLFGRPQKAGWQEENGFKVPVISL